MQGSVSGSGCGTAIVVDVDVGEESTKPIPAYQSGCGGRSKKSAVWKHFTQPFKCEDGNEWVTCCLAGKDGQYKKVAWSGTTSNLMKFLRVHHKDIYNKDMEDAMDMAINEDDSPVLNLRPKVSLQIVLFLL